MSSVLCTFGSKYFAVLSRQSPFLLLLKGSSFISRLNQLITINLPSVTESCLLMFYSADVTVGVKVDRLMMTGLHIVADLFCVNCGSNVGWTYVSS